MLMHAGIEVLGLCWKLTLAPAPSVHHSIQQRLGWNKTANGFVSVVFCLERRRFVTLPVALYQYKSIDSYRNRDILEEVVR